jgi:hypothetical protein
LINDFEYFHEIICIVAIQPFQYAHKRKTISTVRIITEVFHPVTAAPAVEIDIAGSFAVFVKWIQKIAPNTPLARNIVPEYV